MAGGYKYKLFFRHPEHGDYYSRTIYRTKRQAIKAKKALEWAHKEGWLIFVRLA